MKALAVKVEKKIDELLVVLDEDIAHVQQSMSRLNELRSLVVKRDDTSLGNLLGTIRNESDDYISNENKRQSIRKTLASILGCEIEKVTLSKIEACVPPGKRSEVTRRKTELESLTRELKKEYLSTAILLSECVRFNSKLLNGIFDLGRGGTITYNSDGSAKRQGQSAFVSLHF